MAALSVITVTFNSETIISKFLSGLNGRLPDKSEVIVVDNNSSDKTVEIINKYLSRKNLSFELKLIKNNENEGFSKANNKAAGSSSAPMLLFLNPDVKLDLNSALNMVNFFENHPKAGLVAPKLVLSDGKVQASVRKQPTFKGAFLEYFLGLRHRYSEYIPSGETSQEIDCAYGAALMIKRQVFEKISGFNEKYFLYYEDIDLCRRIRELGLKIYYLPSAKAEHLVGGSGSAGEKRSLLNEQSAKIYFGTFRYYLVKLILRLRLLK